MNLKKYFNIQNTTQKVLIAKQLDEIVNMADKDADSHNKNEYDDRTNVNSKCPLCGNKKVVDKISQVVGHGSVSGSFVWGSGGVYGSSNTDTLEVNHCSSCGHQWKKYKTQYKWKSDVIKDYLNHTFEYIKDEKSVWDFYKRDFEKLKPYFAETIYKLLAMHGGDCLSSTKEGLTLELLREKFVSIFDEKK